MGHSMTLNFSGDIPKKSLVTELLYLPLACGLRWNAKEGRESLWRLRESAAVRC